MTRSRCFAAVGLAALLALGVAARAHAQDAPAQTPPKDPPRAFRFVFKERPSLRFGKVLRLDVRAKFQGDWIGLDPDIDLDDRFDVTRARVGLQAQLFDDRIQFEIEREVRDTVYRWRDVFVNARLSRALEVQGGKFKLPFSLEQLTGAMNLDFVNRSRIATLLAPGRDVGVMAHGRAWRRGFTYQAGVFRQDGEIARGDRDIDRRDQKTAAARVTVAPLALAGGSAVFKTLTVGVAATAGNVPEGLNSLRGRTVFPATDGERLFDRLYVRGKRVRLGVELSWAPGPFSVKSEYIHVQDERAGQSIQNTDLADAFARGWYLTGTWVLTGEPKAENVEARRPFPWRGGGAVELAARYERLGFGSVSQEGPAYSNPRAENILPNSDRVVTVGVNWYLNSWAKIQVNAIQERVEDPERSPILGRHRFRTGVVRLQLGM